MPNGPVYQLFYVFNTNTGATRIHPALDAPPVFEDAANLEEFKKQNPGKTAILRSDWEDEHDNRPDRFGILKNLRLINAGSYLWVNQPAKETIQILATGRTGEISGPEFLIQHTEMLSADLLGESIPHIRQREIQKHLGFVLADNTSGSLKIPVIAPACQKEGLPPGFKDSLAYKEQVRRVSAHFRKSGSPYAAHVFEPAQLTFTHHQPDTENYRKILYHSPSHALAAGEKALIHDDGARLNIHTSIMVDIPENAEILLFDPQNRGRQMQALTHSDLFKLCAQGLGPSSITARNPEKVALPHILQPGIHDGPGITAT